MDVDQRPVGRQIAVGGAAAGHRGPVDGADSEDSGEDDPYVPLPEMVESRVESWSNDLPETGAVSLATAHWTQAPTSDEEHAAASLITCWCGRFERSCRICATQTERIYRTLLEGAAEQHSNLSDPALVRVDGKQWVLPEVRVGAWAPWGGTPPPHLRAAAAVQHEIAERAAQQSAAAAAAAPPPPSGAGDMESDETE